MDAAAKGRPFSFKKPCAANSSEIARPHTVALDPLQHIREARAGVDVIGTAHGGVVELVHDLMPGAAGEWLGGLPPSAGCAPSRARLCGPSRRQVRAPTKFCC